MEIQIPDEKLRQIAREEITRYAEGLALREPLVGAKVAAEHTGVKENTLRYWASVNHKNIPVYRFGDRVQFKLSELEEWAKLNNKGSLGI